MVAPEVQLTATEVPVCVLRNDTVGPPAAGVVPVAGVPAAPGAALGAVRVPAANACCTVVPKVQ